MQFHPILPVIEASSFRTQTTPAVGLDPLGESGGTEDDPVATVRCHHPEPIGLDQQSIQVREVHREEVSEA